uniref:Uncharacterized protein n=1 Tax=Sphaerodactylus townsendi TaxID=933632 RepID=A0ACB8FGX1_9SAUR
MQVLGIYSVLDIEGPLAYHQTYMQVTVVQLSISLIIDFLFLFQLINSVYWAQCILQDYIPTKFRLLFSRPSYSFEKDYMDFGCGPSSNNVDRSGINALNCLFILLVCIN